MAIEEKKNETPTETTAEKAEVKAEKKTGICGKILTSIICLLIGAGAMFGVDLARVQETLDKAQVEEYTEIVVAAAVINTIADEGIVNLAITDAKKEELIKSAIEKAKAALPEIWTKIKGTKTVVEEVKDAVETGAEDVKEVTKEAAATVEAAVKAPAADAASATEAAEAAAPAVEQK